MHVSRLASLGLACALLSVAPQARVIRESPVTWPAAVAIPAGGQSDATRPVPTGLTAADWANIRRAYDRHRLGVGADQPRLGQQAYLKASNTDAGDFFGESIAISGDTVVVGASWEASSATGVNGDQTDGTAPLAGAAYVFTRTGGAWTQQAYLKASNTDGHDHLGRSVAISGDTIVVGAVGESSGATGVNGDQTDNSVRNAGAVYVFSRTGATWTQQAYVKASNPGVDDFFGQSVAISGDTIVVGADGEASSATGVDGDQGDNNSPRAGAAYVFVRTDGVWRQQAYLKASNTGTQDAFGSHVAIAGDTIVVGAYGEDSDATGVNADPANDNAPDSGAAYVFVREGGIWTQQAYLKASNTGAFDAFGSSVALAGDTIVIGAPGEDSSATGVDGEEADNSAGAAGAAYVFTRTGVSWAQHAYVKASNTGARDAFGGSVALDRGALVVGALAEGSGATGVNGDQTDDSAPTAGAAYLFTQSGGTWTQQAYLKASNTEAHDAFGFRVAVAGGTIVSSAPREASNATGVNGDQSNNDADESGAAYVLTAAGPIVISALTATPNVLWPPNHKLVPVAVTPTATDGSGIAPVCRITAVRSTEPIWVPGETDWILTGPLTVALRAERAGTGPGRVYTISVTCTNAAGLSAMKEVAVAVPHDRSKR
jgi:hypothetical protein